MNPDGLETFRRLMTTERGQAAFADLGLALVACLEAGADHDALDAAMRQWAARWGIPAGSTSAPGGDRG